MDDSYGLEKVQRAGLRILKEIDRICRKYDIGYLLDSGTLLGAVRHGGFIPWDDDVDISMTREDREKFARVAPSELPEDMHLLMPEEFAKEGKFYDFSPRLVLTSSRRYKGTEESAYFGNMLNHLWVDIFTRDNIPDDAFKARSVRFKHKVVYALAMGHRFKVDKHYDSLVYELGVHTGSAIGRHFNMGALCRKQEELARMYNGEKSEKYYYSDYQPDYLHVELKKEWCEPIELKFEDTYFYAPKNYDEVLREVYGDYMKLPDPDKRVPSHGSKEIEIYE